MSEVLFRDVEVDDRLSDVLVSGGIIRAIGNDAGSGGRGVPRDVVDGAGGALIPGLHDHHLHLLALAADLVSVRLGSVTGREALGHALRSGPRVQGWIRGTGYHESIAGDLDRWTLDALVPDLPVRIQHRSGALWVLNSAGLREVAGVLDASADVELDARRRPTGRLWRYDSRLRSALPDAPPDLAPVGALLARHGITGVTDATPDLDPSSISLLDDARAQGHLPQRVTLLGAPTSAPLPSGLAAGPRKILLRDHDLPAYDDLAALVSDSHHRGRAVAVHCVTRHSLVMTLAVFEEVGVHLGDRIEHASVVPPDVAAWMGRLGVAVVTQPDFLRSRGATYERDVDPSDLPHLYPYASLCAAGVLVAPSSDAPYGGLDPWRIIATARDRPLGPSEGVDASVALSGYLSPPLDPGGAPRRLEVGTVADLVLLKAGLREALEAPDTQVVRSTWIDGELATPLHP